MFRRRWRLRRSTLAPRKMARAMMRGCHHRDQSATAAIRIAWKARLRRASRIAAARLGHLRTRKRPRTARMVPRGRSILRWIRQRRGWDGGGAVAGGSGDVEADCHEPNAMIHTERYRRQDLLWKPSSRRRWWVLGGFAGEGVGSDVEAADRRAGGADFNHRCARDYVGHADGDEELVGTGGGLFEDVLAADVGVG